MYTKGKIINQYNKITLNKNISEITKFFSFSEDKEMNNTKYIS